MDAFALMPAINALDVSLIWIVIGITRSVLEADFTSPVGEIAVTVPSTLSPFKISAVIMTFCPSLISPI